jgi:hypothetical protein
MTDAQLPAQSFFLAGTFHFRHPPYPTYTVYAASRQHGDTG